MSSPEKVPVTYGNITKRAAINRTCIKSTIEIIKKKFALKSDQLVILQVKIKDIDDFLTLNPDDEDDIGELQKCYRINILCESELLASTQDIFTIELPIEQTPSASASKILSNTPENHIQFSCNQSEILSQNDVNVVSVLHSTPTNFSSTKQMITSENFNVKELVRKHKKGHSILSEYDTNHFLTLPTRKLLINIVVAALTEHCLTPNYPSTEEKHVCAKGIIDAFPCLKSTASETGYSHIFSDKGKQSGFIQDRLRSYRKDLSPAKKKRCRRALRPEFENKREESSEKEIFIELHESEAVQLVSFCKKAPLESRSLIMENMDKLFNYRSSWIKESSPTVTDILEKYPRFIDIDELINVDFVKKFGLQTSNELFMKWECSIAPAILHLAKESRKSAVLSTLNDLPIDYTETMVSMWAFFCTLIMLPSFSTRSGERCSVAYARRLLIQFQKVGTNLVEFMAGKQETQPFLLCLGTEKNPEQFFIIVDKFAIPCQNDIVKAMDKLFKTHYIFNTMYASQLKNFYLFLEHYVYGIKSKDKKKETLPSKVIELFSTLNTIRKL